MKSAKNKGVLGLVIIMLIFILLHLPTIDNPYHYDALVWVAQSKYISENGPLSIPPEDYGHPYFLFWSLALFYNSLGESVVISHIIILIFAILTLIGTYLIGKELFNEKVALIAVIFLAFQPWFFTVSNWVYFDIPLASMFTISVYFFIKTVKTDRLTFYWLYVIFGIITALTKEPGFLIILIPFSLFIVKRKFKKRYLIFLIPILATITWHTWHYIVSGYSILQVSEGLIILPTSPNNIFIIGRNYITNIFFHLIQNGNFIAFLVVTYILFYRKHKNLYFLVTILFFIFSKYLFTLIEPDINFYPFLFLMGSIFIFWIIKIPTIKDENKILVIWMGVVILQMFFEQISFRYGLPMVPAFALLFSSSVVKIKRGNLILLTVFILLSLQTLNYTNYYSQRDLIYNNVYDYFSDKTSQGTMLAYPMATRATIAVGGIDSRPVKEISAMLTSKTKEEFEKMNPQYLIVDERSIEFDYTYIKEIMRNKKPEVVYEKEINWYTYYGIQKVFINRLYIYRIY